MLFVRWFIVSQIVTCFVVGGGAVWLFVAVAKGRALWRVPTRVVAVLVSAIALPLGSLFLLGTSCNTPSRAVYSPDGSRAIRVIEDDEGATGGGETVEMYWSHGLRNASLFNGGWASAAVNDVHWIDDRNLQIDYHGDSDDYMSYCRSADSVTVTCRRIPWLRSKH